MSDTIAAISTAMTSSSGIGIVRMSGDDAILIADRIFSGRKPGKLAGMPSHTIHYGFIHDGETVIDEVLLMLMKAPSTYTRENVVEINCHGGPLIMKTVLDTAVKYGARPAEPGEFTKRAFLNGRIDLSQAEAVIDVIQSKSRIALSSSLDQLRGSLRDRIQSLRKEMIHDVAWIEAALDDPEHIDADEMIPVIYGHTAEWMAALTKMSESADSGRLLREGIKTVIIGKPNAGKSSLMNVLLGQDRAIVTEFAGTTRDTLEEQITVAGLPLIIVDTAGIRRTDDTVERIGVERAKSISRDADLIIYVVDSSTDLDQNDYDIIDMIRDRKVIVLMNKSDLKAQVRVDEIKKLIDAAVVMISAKEEKGIDEFASVLKKMFFAGDISYNDEVFITNSRHKAAVNGAAESLRLVRNSIDNGMPEDILTVDLMDAYQQLGYIIGESVGDDMIDAIFSEFCMGK